MRVHKCWEYHISFANIRWSFYCHFVVTVAKYFVFYKLFNISPLVALVWWSACVHVCSLRKTELDRALTEQRATEKLQVVMACCCHNLGSSPTTQGSPLADNWYFWLTREPHESVENILSLSSQSAFSFIFSVILIQDCDGNPVWGDCCCPGPVSAHQWAKCYFRLGLGWSDGRSLETRGKVGWGPWLSDTRYFYDDQTINISSSEILLIQMTQYYSSEVVWVRAVSIIG